MSIAVTNTKNTMGVRTLAGTRNRRFSSSHPRLSGYVTLRGPAYGLRGLGTLGDDTSEAINTLTAAGYDPLTLQALVAQGATADQLYNLPYGPGTTADDMGAGQSALQQTLMNASFRAGTPANQMQTSAIGSTYSGLQAGLALTPPGLIYNSLANPGVNPITTAAQNAGAEDPISSSLASLGISTSQPGAPPAPASTLSQWFLQNWPILALLAGAAIVVPPLIKKL